MNLGVILAGGRSSRMGGGDKGLLELGAGRSLLAEAAARLRPQCGALILNANGDPARFAALGLEVVADGLPDYPGPLAGILAGMDRAAGLGFAEILTAAADTPFFPPDLAARLAAARAAAGAPVALAATRGEEGRLNRHPVFGLWAVDLREDLRAALGEGVARVNFWAARHGAALAEFPVEGFDPFFNVNTPEDLAEARRIWRLQNL